MDNKTPTQSPDSKKLQVTPAQIKNTQNTQFEHYPRSYSPAIYSAPPPSTDHGSHTHGCGCPKLPNGQGGFHGK